MKALDDSSSSDDSQQIVLQDDNFELPEMQEPLEVDTGSFNMQKIIAENNKKLGRFPQDNINNDHIQDMIVEDCDMDLPEPEHLQENDNQSVGLNDQEISLLSSKICQKREELSNKNSKANVFKQSLETPLVIVNGENTEPSVSSPFQADASPLIKFDGSLKQACQHQYTQENEMCKVYNMFGDALTNEEDIDELTNDDQIDTENVEDADDSDVDKSVVISSAERFRVNNPSLKRQKKQKS